MTFVDGDRACDFIEKVCLVTKDSVAGHAGQPIVLRGWQRELVRHLYARRADGSRFRYRQALVGMARKNGKSAITAALGLYDLMFGPEGGEVYCCAADKEQARIVFGTAKRMVELNPELQGYLRLFRDVIEFGQTGSVFRVLSAESYTKEGLNPHKVIFDEVHAQPTRELWDVMSLATGARRDPQMVGITTAGVRTDQLGGDSLCYTLYQYGKRVISGELRDPSFFMAWWEPVNPEDDHRSVDTWREANPGFGDLVDPEDFESAVLRTPENEFRTKRCNQWVATAEAWLPTGAWEACEERRPVPDGAEVVLAFDGSFNNDSTALVVCQAGEKPHLDVAGLWEKPVDADPSWTVPVVEVEDKIREACRRWRVREVACDPHRWARSYQVLDDERLPIVEFPQSPQRMTPATQRFYEAVMNRQVTHSGNPKLARHLSNAVLKIDSRGHRIVKETRNSPRKIDLAVAAVMALDRCAFSVAEYDVLESVW